MVRGVHGDRQIDTNKTNDEDGASNLAGRRSQAEEVRQRQGYVLSKCIVKTQFGSLPGARDTKAQEM